MMTESTKRRLQPILIFVNVALIAGLLLLFIRYDKSYRENIYQQNVDDISNINQAAANTASSFFTSKSQMLKGAALYIEKNDCTPEESMEYLYTTTNVDDSTGYEIIGPDAKGFLAAKNAEGGFRTLDYSRGYGDHFSGIFRTERTSDDSSEVWFLPEFTDAGTAMKSFALYTWIDLRDETGGIVPYTLMAVAKTSDFADLLNLRGGYEGLDTVLIDRDGNYIIGNASFKATNFYQYLSNYNGLSLDQYKEIAEQVRQTGKGVLSYNNSRGVPCVFVYTQVSDSDWFCLSAVPVASFHNRSFDISYTAIAMAVLLFLMVLDFLYMRALNRVLRLSVEKERIASAAKTDFLSRMSHDIRTPMNAIIGYLSIARDADSSADKVRHCLDNCEIAAKQLLQLINDILDMSSIERGKLKLAREEFELRQTIQDVTTIFYQTARVKGVHFETLLDGVTEEWVIGDPLRLNQILMNLISNAVKFTPAGGHVRLTVRQLTDETAPEKTGFCFSVSDTGIGMSKEYMSRLFQPFEQEDSSTAKKYGGSGLGLSIAHNLVGMMGGTIAVESVQNEGTTFTVRLSFETSAEHGGAPEKPARMRVLLVDENAEETACFKAALKMLGVKADTVSGEKEAMRRIEGRLGGDYPYDVCVLDWNSAGLDVPGAAARMQAAFAAQCPAMAVLAYDVTEVVDATKAAGVRAYAAKPMFLSTWCELLNRALGQTRQTTPAELAAETLQMNGTHILLAEDNPMNMEIAVTVLQKAGVCVTQAANGKQAADTFVSSPAGTFDLILMDVQMPVMNGYEATQSIRSSTHPEAKTIPIIAMTANAFAEDVSAALAAGMNGHVAKPVDYPKLYKTMSEFMSGENHK